MHPSRSNCFFKFETPRVILLHAPKKSALIIASSEGKALSRSLARVSSELIYSPRWKENTLNTQPPPTPTKDSSCPRALGRRITFINSWLSLQPVIPPTLLSVCDGHSKLFGQLATQTNRLISFLAPPTNCEHNTYSVHQS